MTHYQITAHVSRNVDGDWQSMRQVPIFGVLKSCGNLTSAAVVANSIIAPYGDMRVSMTVYDFETDEYITVEF